MARANTIQTNFTSGEVSPQMYGRVDVNKYQNGAKKLRNFIVRPQGGISRRPGTKYVGTGKLGSYIRLQPFVFAANQAYVIEFGHLYVRFYFGGSLVVDGSNNPIEVTTPYSYTDLDGLYFAQSADEMFIAHANYPPMVLSRFSNTSWELDKYETGGPNASMGFAMDGPYLDTDTSNNRLQVALVSDITTLDAVGSGVDFTATGAVTEMTTLAVGFISGATVTTLDITNATGIVVGMTVTGLGWDGSKTVTAVSGNNISVASFIANHNSGGNYVFTGPTVTTAVGKYVEFLNDGIYYLAKILTVVSATQVTVLVLDNVFTNPADLVDISIDGSGNITSSYSSAFQTSDVGKYVRSTSAQTWAQSTSLASVTPTSEMAGTLLPVFTYTYPTASMVLELNRIISVTVTSISSIFTAAMVGTQVRMQFGSQWRSLFITAYTSGTQVSGTFNDYVPFDLVNANNIYNGGIADAYAMGAWSSVNGYPSVVAFHSQRLCWANTVTQPSTLWMSQSADFYNMAPTEEDGTVVATDAINVTIASGRADGVVWLKTGQVLLLGTTGAEYEIVNPSSQTGISPTNIDNFQQSQFGSLVGSIAQRCGVATVFLQRGGNKLREMVYMFQYDTFVAKDISIISEHILRDRLGAKYMDYQLDIVSTFWIVANNGDLVGVTYDRDQDVTAFHPHTVAGGTVESVAVIPNTNHDDVYVSVNRTINGQTVRYIELIQQFFDTLLGDTLNTMNFLDSSLTYTGGPVTSVSGLTHLQGQTVSIVANGQLIDSQLVPGTGIVPLTLTTVDNTKSPPVSTTITITATSVAIGLNYSSILATLEPDGGSQAGSSQGERKRISEAICRVKDSLPFKHGPDEQHLILIDQGNFGEGGPGDGSLFTGNVRFSVDMAYDTGASLTIVQDQPYPLTISALIQKVNTNE
jgi:hypothetical protein